MRIRDLAKKFFFDTRRQKFKRAGLDQHVDLPVTAEDIELRTPWALISPPAILLVFLVMFLQAVYGDSVDDIITEVNVAVEEERYTLAVSLLEEGKMAWPLDKRIPIRAGDLYLKQKLYRLALSEYRKADELDPANPDILYDIAQAYGYIGNNNAAVDILEEALDIAKDDDLRETIIDDLSWMYFKTHRMNEGITLLEGVLKEKFNRGFAHTLGTLYSGIYDVDLAREWYNRAIENALDSGDEFFASVAYYNLSLLELSFYQYQDARNYAQRSLELRDRAGGHLVTGELNFMSWDLADALNSYREAERLDSTPLARVDTADFYQRIGRLDESIHFIDKISAEPDDSWMYYYGVDTVRFGMDLNEILANAWKGKAQTEIMTPRWGSGDRVLRFARSIVWKIRGIYYDMRYRSLSTQYTVELAAQGNVLDSEWFAFRSNRGYRNPAMRHLSKARALETSLTAYAEPWYQLDAGIEEKDNRSIHQALDAFQTEERNPVERGLRVLARDSSRNMKDGNAENALRELYAINPGGLRQYGLALPIRLTISGGYSSQMRRRIAKVLKSAGYAIVKNQSPAASNLTVNIQDDAAYWSMANPDGRTISETRTGSIKKNRDVAKVLAGLLNRFYYTNLE